MSLPDGYFKGSSDLGSTFIDMSNFQPTTTQDQPTEEYWMKLMINEGVVLNSTITDGNSKLKN